MNNLVERHSQLINKIGHQRLLALPEGVKNVLKNTTDLETKVRLLEEIDAELEKGGTA